MTTALLAIAMMNGSNAPAYMDTTPAPGQLCMMQPDGSVGDLCPLQRTSVTADVSGYGARVTVTQTFVNPSREVIEAVYTFPLPNDAAVDRMQMKIGTRLVEGEIKRREEARLIYDEAKNAGRTAALLDQERPNIFTQSVANITPGAKVEVVISYVQILKFEKGTFEFNFPMVVGPRYLENTPDADKISPPITPEGTRTGTNIDLTVNIDAGAPIQEFSSVLHKVRTKRQGADGMHVTLAKADEIPNRDFILRYSVSTDSIQDGFIGHMGDKGGFFTLFFMPPKQPTNAQISPKEIIFVMDQSGSQSGFPIEKSKELTLKLIRTLNPADTFNIIGFNTAINPLWREPHLNTPRNIAEAEAFIKGLKADGGTRLRAAAVAALEAQVDPDRLRIVVFNTDGYVGDEAEILKSIHEHRDRARMFTFGVGNSVNRYLIEEMAIAGRGDVEVVTLAEAADGAVDRFTARATSPILTDVSVSIEGVVVDDVLPEALPDVFSERPIMISGRYQAPGQGTITVSGKLGGRPWFRNIEVDFPSRADAPALESIWARRKVDELTRHTFLSALLPEGQRATEEQITNVALEFGIMTQYTSFVAVEKMVVNVGGKQRTVAVPIEMADGVSYEGIFGRDKAARLAYAPMTAAPQVRSRVSQGGGGIGGGYRGAGTADLEGTKVETDDSGMSPEARRTHRFHTKVSKELRESKGRVEVEVWLKKVDEEIVEQLKKLGLTVDFQNAGLKILIGTCDAKALIELAQADVVDRIRKLKA